jgi:hypothetical protein
VHFWTDRHQDITDNLPSVAKELLAEFTGDVVLDSEMMKYEGGKTYARGELQDFVAHGSESPDDSHIVMNVFEDLYLHDVGDISGETWEKRQKGTI